MKKINALLYFLILGTGFVLSCKEESENILTMFKDVKVIFHSDYDLSVTDYKLVNDGDSVYIDYTITSDKEDIYTVVEEKVAGPQNLDTPERPTRTASESERRSYSRVIKLKMQRDGKTSYRIYALNSKGEYIGDGYKKVTIEVNPSYRLITDRKIFAPDSVDKVLPSFFSIMRGQSFSYSDGETNSADIDFGIWRSVIYSGGNKTTIYNYYSLSTPTNPFPIYDISAWAKRATLFSLPVAGQSAFFTYTLVSGSKIAEEAKKVNITTTSTNYSVLTGSLQTSSIVYFLTPEGKYGVIHVNQSPTNRNQPYINITVKIQN